MRKEYETSITYTSETAFFSSDEMKWINKIHKLQKEHPDKVFILKEPQDNDGCIYCKLPSSWLNLRPKAVMSEERRREAAERLRQYTYRSESEAQTGVS